MKYKKNKKLVIKARISSKKVQPKPAVFASFNLKDLKKQRALGNQEFQLFPNEPAYAEGFGPTPKLVEFLQQPVSPKTIGVVSLLNVFGLVLLLGTLIFPTTQVNQLAIVNTAQTVKTASIVAGGESVKWTTFVKISDINSEKYLLSLPKKAKNIKIIKVTAQQAKDVLQQKPTQKLALNQRIQIAQANQHKSSFTASIFNSIGKYFTAGLEGAVDGIIPTPDTTVVDLSSQVEITPPAPEVVPADPVVEPAPIVEPVLSETPVVEEASAPIEESTEYVKVDYETPAPVITEELTDTGKIVTVSSANSEKIDCETLNPAKKNAGLPAEVLRQAGASLMDGAKSFFNSIIKFLAADLEDSVSGVLENIGIVQPPVETPADPVIQPDAEPEGSANPQSDQTATQTILEPVVVLEGVLAPVEPLVQEQLAPVTEPAAAIKTPPVESINPAQAEYDACIQSQVPLVDVLASTKIPEIYKVGEEDKIHIKWKNNGNQDVIFTAYDTDNNGKLDYVEWTVPHLSEQVFEIIFISKAFELDENQNVINDIYDQVQAQDGVYATVLNNNYVRVTFEQVLNSSNDITIYAKSTDINATNVSIEAYPVYTDPDGNKTQGPKLDLVNDGTNSDFSNISQNGKYRILLSNLQTATDTFDLKVTSPSTSSGQNQSAIDFDYIVDPDPAYYSSGVFYSSNILAGEMVNNVDYFGYNVSIPTNTTLQIMFSQDLVNWYSANHTLNTWTNLQDGNYLTQDADTNLNLSGFTPSQYLYYQIALATTDTTVTPTLTSVQIYHSTGNYATVSTGAATSVLGNSATGNATISSIGSSTITERGFQYGLSQTSYAQVSETGSFGTGDYFLNLPNLTAESTYYVRAFVTNTQGRAYGEWQTFVSLSFYNTSATLYSSNLLEGQTVNTIDTFVTSATVPSGTSLSAQFSQDLSAWYGADGVLNHTTTISDGTTTISLTALAWTGANFYYKIIFNASTDQSLTPTLTSVAVDYNMNTAPTLTSLTPAPTPIKGGSTITITPSGQGDGESNTLYYYCAESTAPTSANTICLQGNASYTSANYSTMTCAYAVATGDATRTVYCRTYDGTAYSTEITNTYMVDTTAPAVGATTLQGFTTFESYIKGTGTILGGTATDTGGSGIDNTTCEYTVDNGGSWAGATWVTNHCEKTNIAISNATSYIFNTRIKDAVTNQGTGTASSTYTGDTLAPTTADNSNTTWWADDQTITLSPTDDGSGVNATNYCVDTTGACAPTTPGTSVSVTCDSGTTCQKYIRYYSNDKLGNTEATNTSKLINIDKENPITTADATPYIFNTWTNQNVTVSLSCADTGGSGCLTTLYCIDANNTCTPNISYSVTPPTAISTSGISYIRYLSTDAVSNTETVKSQTINILYAPLAPSLIANLGNQITVDLLLDGNPVGTEYYIENANNSTSSGWIMDTSWTATNLSCGTSYSFKVKARSAILEETGWSSLVSTNTLGCPAGGGGYNPAYDLNRKANIINGIGQQLNNVAQQLKNIVNIFNPNAEQPQIQYPPIAESVPAESPLALQGWNVMEVRPLNGLAFDVINSNVGFFYDKIPQFKETLTAFGIDVNKLSEVQKIVGAELYLPGLTQVALAQVGDLATNKLVPVQGVPLADLSSSAKQKIPTDIVFVRSNGGLIDYNVAISVNSAGQVAQKINTISGKTIDLVMKPDKPAKSVVGFMTLKSVAVGETKPNVLASLTRFLTASIINSVQENVAQTDNENALLINKFAYEEVSPGIFKATISAPQTEGEYDISTVIQYKDINIAPKETKMTAIVNPEGYVYRQMPDGRLRVEGVKVSLYWLNPKTNQYELWLADKFLQKNPVLTDNTGKYSFLVPEGTYKIAVKDARYLVFESEPFTMKGDIAVNQNIELFKKSGWFDWLNWQVVITFLLAVLIIYNLWQNEKIKSIILKVFKFRKVEKIKNPKI